MHNNVSFSCGLKVSTAFSRFFRKQYLSHVAPSEFVKSLRAFCAIFIQGTENAVESTPSQTQQNRLFFGKDFTLPTPTYFTKILTLVVDLFGEKWENVT